MNKIVRGEIHPLGCPLDEKQLPRCLEEQCVLWMNCGAYVAYERSKQELKEQEHEDNNQLPR